jgi:hypothetical protein
MSQNPLYRSAFDLAQDLAEAEATGTRPEFIRKLTRVDLLVIEDLGMRHTADRGGGPSGDYGVFDASTTSDQLHPNACSGLRLYLSAAAAGRRARAPVPTPRADRPTVAAERLRALEEADWADGKAWPSVLRTILHLRLLSSLQRRVSLTRATGQLALGASSVVEARSTCLADP